MLKCALFGKRAKKTVVEIVCIGSGVDETKCVYI